MTGAGLPLPARKPLAQAIDGGAVQWAANDAALASGEIDEAEWYARNMAVLVPKYLAAENPRAQSGHSGDEAQWEAARRPMLSAVDQPGDFLDVGCASGYLMESVRRWAAQDGTDLEPYGLDLSPELAELARERLPDWADRIWIGNALYWMHPEGHRFTYVRTGLEYVPPGRAPDLIAHLLEQVVGRRLIIGVYNEGRDEPKWERVVTDAGYRIAGRREWIKPGDDRIARRVFWIDAQ